VLNRPVLTAAAACVTVLALSGPLAQTAQAARAAHPAAGLPRTAGATLVADLRRAWRTTRGQGVTVAVIGGSVDRTATGLAGKVTTGPAYGHPGQGQATEGTLFASAVAGSGPSQQNPFHALGIAPRARILSLSVRSTLKTPAWLTDVAKAIGYAAAHGAKVIYVEQTSYTGSARLAAAVAGAVAKNVVIIGAEYGPARLRSAPEYPASLPGVLGAASVILRGWSAPPSQLPSPANGSILVSAPGNVLTASGPAAAAYPLYNFFSAGAWLTATAALIKSAYPDLPTALVARAIARSARDRPAGGYSPAGGFGLINPAGALTEAGQLTGLRTAAAPGKDVVAPSARLATGPAPGPVQAVHHSIWTLAGYALLILAGLIVVLRTRRLSKRWRRRARLPTAQSHRIGRGQSPAQGPAGAQGPAPAPQADPAPEPEPAGAARTRSAAAAAPVSERAAETTSPAEPAAEITPASGRTAEAPAAAPPASG
jgi:hypothetical protein